MIRVVTLKTSVVVGQALMVGNRKMTVTSVAPMPDKTFRVVAED